MAFDGLNAEQYLRRAGFRPDHLVIDCPNKPLIENAFREILSTKGDTANHDLNYIGYLRPLWTIPAMTVTPRTRTNM